ncbi:MAG: MFS transporter [Acidobacteria bacterium]|nr:MFS transporter [Acidobacteriota bacterium]
MRKKNIIALGFTSFFNDFSSEMIYPLLPAFLAIKLGAGPVGLGIVEGIAESTAAVIKLFSGIYSDKTGKRKPIFFSGYLFSNIVRPLIAFVGNWYQLLLLRFGDRVGKGVRTAPRDALLADSAGTTHRSFAFGFHRAMDHLGAMFGPVVAWVMMNYFAFGYRDVFLASAIPGVFVMLVIIFFVKEIKPDTKPEELKKATSTDKNIKTNVLNLSQLKTFPGTFRRYLTAILIATLGNSTDAFLLLLAYMRGISEIMIPLLWTFLHISKMLFNLLFGYIGDKTSRLKLIISGWFVYSLIYFGFAFSTKPIHIWILFALYGLYYGMTEGNEKALVADFVSKKDYGAAYGIYNLVIGIGALPASIIFGIIWKLVSAEAAFIFGAALAMLAALIMTGVKNPDETA